MSMHNGMPWYKHNVEDWLNGTRAMTAEERGCYITVVDLMYMYGGWVADNSQWLAGQCNISTRRWNMIRDNLVNDGKLIATDGRLSNARALEECLAQDETSKVKQRAGKLGGKRSGEIRRKTKEIIHEVSIDINDVVEADASEEPIESAFSYDNDYPPDYPPENLGDQEAESEQNQDVARTRILEKKERESKEDGTESVPLTPIAFEERKRGNPRHPANGAGPVRITDARIDIEADSGRLCVNGYYLDTSGRRCSEEADRPIADQDPYLIDLLAAGYTLPQITRVIAEQASKGRARKHMAYYAKIVRSDVKPEQKAMPPLIPPVSFSTAQAA